MLRGHIQMGDLGVDLGADERLQVRLVGEFIHVGSSKFVDFEQGVNQLPQRGVDVLPPFGFGNRLEYHLLEFPL